MKIRMNTLLAGPAGILEAGKIYDVDPDQANQLVTGGYAVLLEKPARVVEIPVQAAPGTPVETTAYKPHPEPEQAVQSRPRGRRKAS